MAIPGQWWWVQDEEQKYFPGKVIRLGDPVTIEREDGTVLEVSESRLELVLDAPELLDAQLEDLVQMETVNEAAIIDTLRRRYAKDKIYTAIADILIAINPYKQLPLYATSTVREYARADTDASPHPFKTTMSAYRAMRETGKPQAILISGESGAGKTETTKACLKVLSECAGSGRGPRVEEKLLSTNPVLETLGNAKTVRNNNSSRFGKFMEIKFDADMKINCCDIIDYLLEKSRVTTCAKNERSYHIFYQLCGHSGGRRGLRAAQAYPSLSASGCTLVDGIDDEAGWESFLASLESLDYSEAERDNLLDACAAVVWASAISFDEADDEGSIISTAPGEKEPRRRRSSVSLANCACEVASAALGIEPTALADVLTHRTINVGGQSLKTNLTARGAADCRDALSKHVYGAVFHATVKRINVALKEDAAAAKAAPYSIGALDIFGFEIFENNSFEQLCINYCNEKLQRHFTRHTFDQEVAVYRAEGVSFDDIVYADNSDVIELLENRKKGLFRMLDDEVKAPGGSDTNFCAKLQKSHRDNDRLSFDRRAPDVFLLSHYAGQVRYDTAGFVVKNKDRLYDDVAEALLASKTNTLVASLFAHHGAVKHQKGSKATCGGRFVSQLATLVDVLDCARPHYVRCIKPNKVKKPLLFEGKMCHEQLKFAGVFEACLIRQQGYPFRQKHAEFFRQYWLAVPKLQRRLIPTPRQIFELAAKKATVDTGRACRTLLQHLHEDDGDESNPERRVAQCKVGWTLVLWRAPQQRRLLNFRMKIEYEIGLRIGTRARVKLAVRLRHMLVKARKAYAEVKVLDNPDAVIDAKLAEIGTPWFESRDLRRLRLLKHRIARERELNPEYERMAALSLEEIDSRFERLVEEGRKLELDSELFQKVDRKYAIVVEKREAVKLIRSAKESTDPDEAALRAAVSTLERLCRTYGRNAMETPEEIEAKGILVHLREEARLTRSVVGASSAAKLTTPLSRDALLYAKLGHFEASANALRRHGARKLLSRTTLELADKALAARKQVNEAVETERACDDARAWDDAARKAALVVACAEELVGTNKHGLDIIEPMVEVVSGDAEHILKLCHARCALSDTCAAANAKSPPDEDALRAAIATADSLPYVADLRAELCVRTVQVARDKLARRIKERRLLGLVLDSLSKETPFGNLAALPTDSALQCLRSESVSTTSLAHSVASAHDYGIHVPEDALVLRTASLTLEVRKRMKTVLETKDWDRAAGDDFVRADQAWLELCLAKIQAMETFASQKVSDWPKELQSLRAELDLAERLAATCSVRAEVCSELAATCRVFERNCECGGKNGADYAEVARLRRAVYVAAALSLERSCAETPDTAGVENPEAVLQVVRRATAVMMKVEEAHEALELATRRVDDGELKRAIDLAESVCLESSPVVEARALLKRLVRLVDEARKARSSLDRAGLLPRVAREATELGFENDDIRAVRSYLAFDEPTFLKLVLKRAICQDSLDLATEASVRLHNVYFAGGTPGISLCSLERSPALKTPAQYCKVRFYDPTPDLATRKQMATMLTFSHGRPLSSLTVALGKDTDGDNAAQELFGRIVGYMGDSIKPRQERDKLCDKIVGECRARPTLIDEAYVQIIKQLTGNPNAVSRERGWRIIEAFVDADLAPSSSLLIHVEAKLRQALVVPAACTLRRPLAPRLVAAWFRSRVVGAGRGHSLSGWLQKDVFIDKDATKPACRKFRGRYFVLNKDVLLYFDAEPSKRCHKPIGCHKVANLGRVWALWTHDSPFDLFFPFVVDKGNKQGRSLVLSASSAEERATWITSIEVRFPAAPTPSYCANPDIFSSQAATAVTAAPQQKQLSSSSANWLQAVDHRTGQPYYWNRLTLATSWTFPKSSQ